MIAGAHAVLWVRQDALGNDACRFADAEGGYLIDGSATDSEWNIQRYRIRARANGSTRRARLGVTSRIIIRRTSGGKWSVNDTPMPDVTGAFDIDLGFTPATITLPIRRLKLAVGAQADLTLAHYDAASQTLKPLHQTLHRTAKDTYTLTNPATGTSDQLKVNKHNIVQDYTGRWMAQK